MNNNMIKIYLQRSNGRLSQRGSFVLADNEKPILDFVCDYVMKDFVVSFKNEHKQASLRFKNTTQVAIPYEFLEVGVLEVKVDLIAYGKTQVTYHVEPIVFARVDAHFEGHAEIEELRQLVKRQGELLHAQNEIIGGLEARLAIAEAEIHRIWEASEL